MAIVNIDNKQYDTEKMSQEAINHVASVQECDRRITDLQNEIRIISTARTAYMNTLKSLLESKN